MYNKVINKLTIAAISNLQRESIDQYRKALEDMTEEFSVLNMNIVVCRRESTNRTLCDIKDKLESYYRSKYRTKLFPLFIPFSAGKLFDNVKTKEFINCSKQFFVRYYNGYYYCLPIDTYKEGIVSIIPPESLEEEINGFGTPVEAMLDFYIHLIEATQKKYGYITPSCTIRQCEYNYAGKCVYSEVRIPKPELRMCKEEN